MDHERDDLTIRPATAADASAIARIHVASWREAYAGIVPTQYLANLDVAARQAWWDDVLGQPASRTWVAELDQRTVGFAHLGPAGDEDAEPEDLELYAIYLDPETWGRGVARDLMRAVLDAVPASSAVSLWVLADNERARRFYKRHGFEPDGVEKIEEIGGKPLTEVRYRRG
jgi:RimJ/RimL family protein N-acetyltransferase